MMKLHKPTPDDVPEGHVQIEKHWPRHALLAALFNHVPKPAFISDPVLKMEDGEARSLIERNLPITWLHGRKLMLAFDERSFNAAGYIACNGNRALEGALNEMRTNHPEPQPPRRLPGVRPALRHMLKKHLL